MNIDKSLNDFLPDKNSSYSREFKETLDDHSISLNEVIDCIKTVQDPEIPVNLYDLGLIYNIKITQNNIIVDMTLTNPNCPVAGIMPENVGKSLENLKGIRSINVNLVWEPKWSKDLMSEDAKLALDIF